MAWAANRTTTRLEDEAYCLLGIFQVNMPMLYGEGKNAFRRLQEEIIKQSDDQTLFAWHDDRDIKPVLAPSVSCFEGLHDLKCIYATNDSRFGHTLSNSGLNIKLMLIPWDMDIYVAPLSCGRALFKPQGLGGPPTRDYSRMAIFLRRTKFEDHLVRVSVNDKDFVMLDSDVVAYKRDSFGIKDRQVFVRQSLVDLPDPIKHSFAFNYHRPQMFSNGLLPGTNDLLNFSDRAPNGYYVTNHIHEPYSHYESVAFNITNSSADKRPHYLHLGFDLNFAPVCLVTTEPWLAENRDRVCEYDFKEMPSFRSKSVSSLPWLLSQVKAGKTSNSILAFKATPGASTEVRCRQLSLKIMFEAKRTAYDIAGLDSPAKMWHVSFEHFQGIPPAPPTPDIPLQLPAAAEPTDSKPTPQPNRGSPWLKLLTFKKVKALKNTDVKALELIQESDTTEVQIIPHRGQVTRFIGRSRTFGTGVVPTTHSDMTQVLGTSSMSPDYTMESISHATMTPLGNLVTPAPPIMDPVGNYAISVSKQEHRRVPTLLTPAIPESYTPFRYPRSYPSHRPHEMGSDELRQAIAASDTNEPAVEHIQPRGPGTIYELDGNDLADSIPYPDLSPIEESLPDLIPSEMTPTIDRLDDGSEQEWSAQTIDYLRKMHDESPPDARLRVVNV